MVGKSTSPGEHKTHNDKAADIDGRHRKQVRNRHKVKFSFPTSLNKQLKKLPLQHIPQPHNNPRIPQFYKHALETAPNDIVQLPWQNQFDLPTTSVPQHKRAAANTYRARIRLVQNAREGFLFRWRLLRVDVSGERAECRVAFCVG